MTNSIENTMNYYTATITSDGGFTNGMSGRTNSKATVLINENGEYGFLPTNEGEVTNECQPYKPLGGRKTLITLLADGNIVFKSYDFGIGFEVNRGRRVKF